MKISLLHPSRGRAKKSFETTMRWASQAGCDLELVVSLDVDDSTLSDYVDLYMYDLIKLNGISGNHNLITRNGEGLIFFSRENKNVVEATNHAAKHATGDILLYLSDDFDCFPNWGQAVIKEFEGENRPLLIKVDDMLQPINAPVLTIPILNRFLYERLGYFWHPSYASMWVDVDLYYTVRQIGALKNCPHLKFEHKHVSVGKAEMDETYRRSSANWEQGKALFAKRKRLKFPI